MQIGQQVKSKAYPEDCPAGNHTSAGMKRKDRHKHVPWLRVSGWLLRDNAGVHCNGWVKSILLRWACPVPQCPPSPTPEYGQIHPPAFGCRFCFKQAKAQSSYSR